MKNKIEDLRNHLFATIEGLLDDEKPLDVHRAKAVAEVASVLIDSAKVEISFLDKLGGQNSGFITSDTRILEGQKQIESENKD
jgi:hypothetical protein